jgi:hypothetical protein
MASQSQSLGEPDFAVDADGFLEFHSIMMMTMTTTMRMRTTVVFSTRIPLKIRDAKSDKKKKRLTTMPVIRPSDIVRCHWSIFPAWSLVLVTRR